MLVLKDFFTKILETKPISFPGECCCCCCCCCLHLPHLAPPFQPASSLPPVSSLHSQHPQTKPVYIRCFSFYPSVTIRVDYQAKRRLYMDQVMIIYLSYSVTIRVVGFKFKKSDFFDFLNNHDFYQPCWSELTMVMPYWHNVC